MRFSYGTKNGTLNSQVVSGNFTRISAETYDQEGQPIHIGPDVQRSAQRGLFKVKIGSCVGGLNSSPHVLSLEEALDTYSWNPGWQTRIRGVLVLPYALNGVGSITSDEDISGGVAANWRALDCISSLNTAGEVMYTCLGHKMFGPTSLSDATPVVEATFTDVITCVNELVVNGARVFAVAGGATDNVKHTTTPDNPSWTTTFDLSAGDYITAMAYLPTVGPGVNIVVGKVGGVNGVWWFPTDEAAPVTLRPCVTTVSKDQKGSIAPVTISNTNPTTSGNEGVGAKSSAEGIWLNTGNIFASDNADATYGLDGVATGGSTSFLLAGGFNLTAMPKGSIMTGMTVQIEHAESDAANNVFLQEVQLRLGGSQVGFSRSGGDELGTTDSTDTLGSTSDDWGTAGAVTGVNVGALNIAIKYVWTDSASAGETIQVDHVSIPSFVYQLLGSTVSFPIGGHMVNRNPVFPARITIRTPSEDQATAITKPREMWHLDFEWQADQERPTFTYTQPNEGARYTWAATSHQGGYGLAVGYSAADRGILLKHSDASGGLRDYKFFGTHGDYTAKINDVYSWGAWMLLDVYYVNSIGTVVDRQFVWLSRGLTYHTDFLMQSYSNFTIAAQPIPHGTCYVDPTLKVVRTWYPNGTDTASMWTFVPPDPELDPQVNYTDQVKSMRWTGTSGSRTEDTVLEIRGNKVDVGHEEANKAATEVALHSNRVSASSGSYGEVTFKLENDGNAFDGSTISNEFTAGYGTPWQIPSGGLAYDYLQWQIEGKHAAGTVKSPNALSFLLTTVQQWIDEWQFTLWCDRLDGGYFAFRKGLLTLKASKPTHPLYIDGVFPGTSENPALLVAVEKVIPPSRPLLPEELTMSPLPDGMEVGIICVSKPGKTTA